MPSPFHGIDTSARALRAFQRMLETTGHNIANVNTRGYSRQTVDLGTSEPLSYFQMGERSLGTGVIVGSINRARDLFLESRMRNATGDMTRYQTMATNVKGILGVLREPGADGISAALGKFFDSWSGLASNPAENANRLAVQTAGKDLAGRIRAAWQEFNTQNLQKTDEITSAIAQVNDLGKTISDLNDQIRAQLATGGQPNDLMDSRDLAIRDLSQLVNVHTTQLGDGTITVNVSEFTLVDTTGYRTLPDTYDPATGRITGWTVPVQIRSGQLSGLLQSVGQNQAAMDQLDDLANNLRTHINTLHLTGTNPNGTTGIRFFNDVAVPPQTGAVDFDLSADVLADFRNISNSTGGASGDGGLALSIANARRTSIAALGNKTFIDFHKDEVTRLGGDAAFYQSVADTQSAILNQIDQQQQAVSGVNLDDEMANMLRFQRAYQAAAKTLTTFDQVTEDLINMLRR